MSKSKWAVMAFKDAWGHPAEIRIEKLSAKGMFRLAAFDSDSVNEDDGSFGSAPEAKGHAALNLSVEEMKFLAMTILNIVRDSKADE
jgi:hypothetical protein